MTDKKMKAVILLSGGLDSLTSISASDCDIKLGLIFDYGQKSFEMEYMAAKIAAEFYGFPLEKIDLKWIKSFTDNALLNPDKYSEIKGLSDINELEKSMKSVWVPNRNALFCNIAASFAEGKNLDAVIIGANREEGVTFKDNTKEFVKRCNSLFEFSTNSGIKLIAPLIDMDKAEIVKLANEKNVPLEYVYSCYNGGKKHCGKCESCLHLKSALENVKREDLINHLF